jgi:hypothetical protein
MLDRLLALFRGRATPPRTAWSAPPAAAEPLHNTFVEAHPSDADDADAEPPPPYQYDQHLLAEADAFLATVTVTDEELAAVPESFSGRGYLARNPGVLKAGWSPWAHYIKHGREEGRTW